MSRSCHGNRPFVLIGNRVHVQYRICTALHYTSNLYDTQIVIRECYGNRYCISYKCVGTVLLSFIFDSGRGEESVSFDDRVYNITDTFLLSLYVYVLNRRSYKVTSCLLFFGQITMCILCDGEEFWVFIE